MSLPQNLKKACIKVTYTVLFSEMLTNWRVPVFSNALKKLIKLLPKENLFCSRRRSYSNFVCLFCFNCLLIHETNYLFPGAFIVWQNSNDFLFQEERDDETGVFTYKYISATTNQAEYLGVSSNCIDRNLYVNCKKKTDGVYSKRNVRALWNFYIFFSKVYNNSRKIENVLSSVSLL